MAIDFYGETFDKYEREHSKAYVGYFSPDGRLVDYNTPLGGSHSTLGNVVSWTFLMWVKNAEAFREFGLQEVDTLASFDMKTGVVKNASIPIEKYNKESNLSLLQDDLLSFLRKVNSDPETLNKIRESINYNKIPEYIRMYKKLPLYVGESPFEIESVFGKENTKNLLLLLKDICVQYLGYDSIEQVKPDGTFLKFPDYYYLYPKDYLTYFEKPRIITSPNSNVTQRFFNYLLMDWKIQESPKYFFNPETNRFELEQSQKFFSRDEIYQEEIDSIRRLVPLKDRPKYFR